MKSKKQKSSILMFVAVILLTTISPVIAYPPDNAAVLYYKAFMTVKEADEEVDKMLNDSRKGNIKPNDRIRRYIQQNKRAIEIVETAADVRNCDWGNDISKGFDVLLPELTKTRKMKHINPPHCFWTRSRPVNGTGWLSVISMACRCSDI